MGSCSLEPDPIFFWPFLIGIFILVPTLCVGTHPAILRALCALSIMLCILLAQVNIRDVFTVVHIKKRGFSGRRSHAEHGNEISFYILKPILNNHL